MSNKPPSAKERIEKISNATNENWCDPAWICRHCLENEIRDAEQAAREQAFREAANIAEGGTLAYPKRYNWAKQNYTGGWNQSRHNLARELRALAEKE